MEKSLKAWGPYALSRRCFEKLDKISDVSLFPDWDIYWLAAITSIRAVWHVLSEQDLRGEPLKEKIFSEYKAGLASYDIFQSFVRDQRDRTLKRWEWDIIVQDFMIGKRSDGKFVPDHKALIFKYPNPEQPVVDTDERLQGEDPLRLLGIALTFLHEHLSMMEIAIVQNRFDGFRADWLLREYSHSQFFDQEPKFYR